MSDWSKYGIHKGLFLWPALWVFVAWSIFLFEQATGTNLGQYGMMPGEIAQWYGPFTFPWLHSDINHILSNTVSLFFVGALIRYSFPENFDKIWILSLLLPGFLLWFVGRPNIHIGASAWLYALVSYVFFSGLLRMHIKLLAQSMLMVFLYGSFVWGVLPHDPTISYEGHLSGALIGVVLAVYYRKIEPINALKDEEPDFGEEVSWEDWRGPLYQPFTYEVISPRPDKPLQPLQGPQFRYEDGSSPDELA